MLELYGRFFPGMSEVEAHAFVEMSRAETMAEFQGVLLELETQGNLGIADKADAASLEREEVCPR
jgi:chaperone BCS1